MAVGNGRRRAAGLVTGLFAVVVLVVFALVRAPVPASSGPPAGLAGNENGPHTHVAMAGMPASAVPVGGTAARAGGYGLVPSVTTFRAGVAGRFTFHVEGPDGRPVTRFAVVHDKPLHLIIVRDDLSGFQHLHPAMAADGTWSVPLTLAQPGRYRAYADFVALDTRGNQAAAVLGVDLTVPGTPVARPLPPPAGTDHPDGLTVTMAGTPAVGTVEPLLFTVDAPLQPYLGAYGHLVMVRQGDLGYMHIHPEPALAGGAIKFWVAAPGPDTYRAYLNFQVAGAVHTAEFTVVLR